MTLKTVTTHTAFTTIITLMKLKALATPLFPCLQKMTTYVFDKGFVVVSRGKWSLSIATLFTEMGHLGLLGHIVASLLIREINPTEPAFDSNITSKLSCDFKL